MPSFEEIMKKHIANHKQALNGRTSMNGPAFRAEQEDALKAEERAERAKKQREREEAQRTAELEAEKRRQEKEEYMAKMMEKARRHREEEAEEEDRAMRQRRGLPPKPKAVADDDESEKPVPDDQVIKELEELGEPATLPDESVAARSRRWQRLTGKTASGLILSKGPIPTTLKLVEEKDMKIPAVAPKDKEGKQLLFRQLASYFTMILEEWQDAMDERDQETKDSYQGKLALNVMKTARDELVPFFRRLEKGDLQDNLIEPLVKIVHAAQERRYVDGNNAYLELSIGKSTWPIGVTMVGIHERSARENINSNLVTPHIFSDEATRKYLQSMKRCLTFAQSRWPPDDGSQLMG